ncbi:hypothetical protein LCGC14_3025990, partial [marine sediment metagenome]
VDDPALKKELERIAIASVDHVFGRNPMLHAAPSHPDQGFPEIFHVMRSGNLRLKWDLKPELYI